MLTAASSSVFTGWRVYAMSSRNQWLAGFALVGSAVPVFTNMVGSSHYSTAGTNISDIFVCILGDIHQGKPYHSYLSPGI